MRNIFLEKSHTKCGGETSPRLFSEKLKIEHIPGSIACSFVQFVFNVCQVQGYRNILKLTANHLLLRHIQGNQTMKLFS